MCLGYSGFCKYVLCALVIVAFVSMYYVPWMGTILAFISMDHVPWFTKTDCGMVFSSNKRTNEKTVWLVFMGYEEA